MSMTVQMDSSGAMPKHQPDDMRNSCGERLRPCGRQGNQVLGYCHHCCQGHSQLVTPDDRDFRVLVSPPARTERQTMMSGGSLSRST